MLFDFLATTNMAECLCMFHTNATETEAIFQQSLAMQSSIYCKVETDRILCSGGREDMEQWTFSYIAN